MLRRTRFVCVSDTHNMSPLDGTFKLPDGDVLIHAGDLTKQGTLGELQRTVAWLEKADYEAKIVIAGNHDITLDEDFYAQYGAHFHNQEPQISADCRRILQDSLSITYLEDTAADIYLQDPNGPRTKFRVFGSPRSLRVRNWAFQYPAATGAAIWSRIPLDTDITVTHTPPYLHCDLYDGGREGCEALRQALWRVRPRLAVCGHIHDARGAERIEWDLGRANVRFKEARVGIWEDESRGTKKLARLDLSIRGGDPLRNDGSHPALLEDLDMGVDKDANSYEDVDMGCNKGKKQLTMASECEPTSSVGRSFRARVVPVPLGPPINETTVPTAVGLGGDGESARCDIEALRGRLGRIETCVVNASIMGSSWPYKGLGGERYHKAIVVDIDLPVWNSGEGLDGTF